MTTDYKTGDIATLQTLEAADVPRFSFAGQLRVAKCARVHDGDTITAIIAFGMGFGNPFCHVQVRFAACDTAELHGGGPAETAAAEQTRDHVAGLIGGKLVLLRCYDFDKYGRILADVWPVAAEELPRSLDQQGQYVLEQLLLRPSGFDLTARLAPLLQRAPLNKQLVAEGWAYSYSGRTKSKFEDWAAASPVFGAGSSAPALVQALAAAEKKPRQKKL